MTSSQKIKIVEVGARDGLQNEKGIIPTEAKIEFINLLSQSGLPVIEVSSFVHPKWVPQLADVAEVYTQIQKKIGVQYPCLVPNLKGLERALSIGVKEIAVFTAASETFNQKNINMSIEASLQGISEIVKVAKQEKIWVRGYVSTCFVCPYEGKVAPDKVVPVIQKLHDLGCDELSIGDTIGSAMPEDVSALFEKLFPKIPVSQTAVHFHDTKGKAIDNILKSLEFGIAIVDSSAGGLGGCPYAPGAAGNVSTELVLTTLHQKGFVTGVDLTKVTQASQFIRRHLSPVSQR